MDLSTNLVVTVFTAEHHTYLVGVHVYLDILLLQGVELAEAAGEPILLLGLPLRPYPLSGVLVLVGFYSTIE